MKKAVCVAKTLGTCLSVFYEYRPDQCLHGIKFAIQVSSYTHNGSKDVKLVETDEKNDEYFNFFIIPRINKTCIRKHNKSGLLSPYDILLSV